jgi:hypothetical protein
VTFISALPARSGPEANWLSAHNGPFRIIHLYAPKSQVLRGTWKLPRLLLILVLYFCWMRPAVAKAPTPHSATPACSARYSSMSPPTAGPGRS